MFHALFPCDFLNPLPLSVKLKYIHTSCLGGLGIGGQSPRLLSVVGTVVGTVHEEVVTELELDTPINGKRKNKGENKNFHTELILSLISKSFL